MSTQTIVAAAEPPEGPRPSQPSLFGAVKSRSQRPDPASAPKGATTYRWRACLRHTDCGTCAADYAEAIRTLPWDKLPARPAAARHTRDTRIGRTVMKSEDFCREHAEAKGYKGRA